jgi:hypothetical protein
MQDPLASVPHILSYYDLLLAPIYFLLLLMWVIYWKKKHYQQAPFKKYIVPAFTIKAISCVLLALLYEFYYGYSDAHNYYTGAVEIWIATKHNPLYGLQLVFEPMENWSPAAQQFSIHMSYPGFTGGITNMFRISGLIGMFCFGTYLPIALVISLLSFLGSWKIFKVFAEEFPAYYKQIALTCLFAPSFVFWGTNILKDPLCIYGLGLCVEVLYKLFKGKFSFYSLLKILIGSLLILSLKSYIFYIFFIAGLFAIYVNAVSSVNARFKIFIRLGMTLIVLFAIVLVVTKRNFLADIFTKEIMNEVTVVQNVQKDQGGSVYILPDVDDSSFPGILKTYLRSLNVALFRPYVWETPNIIAVANALESLAVLLLTLYLLIKLKITGFFVIAFENRVLAFSLLFTLLLAPLAGLVSFNFGTLVRYKAPIVPFYYTYLIVLFCKLKEKKALTKLKGEKLFTVFDDKPL